MENTKNLSLAAQSIQFSGSDNIKRIEGPQIGQFLTRLSGRLTNLSEVLKREGDDFVNSYISTLNNSIIALKLKYELEAEDKIDLHFTIAPRESGFPTEKDFYLLEKNKAEADEILGVLPKREEIIDKIRRAVMRRGSVINGQMMLRRHNFYSHLEKNEVITGYNFGKPELVNVEDGKRFYTLSWNCIERNSKLPVFYRMCLTQDDWRKPLENTENAKLETIIYQTQINLDNLNILANLFDNEIEEIHPKHLQKVTIGPYYDSLTDNNPEIEKLFESTDDPSILKFKVDIVSSERVKKYGRWIDFFWNRKTEREIFYPDLTETKMIVPFRIKQELGNNDEYGVPCKLYGVTNGGEIIG